MQLKDYYKTLRIQPTATHQQVKKSFRQLAHLYHPDKNQGNAVAEAAFREIQEAYETLGDPGKREEYNYKRWYNRSVKESFVQEALTPQAILRESRHLHEYLQTVNVLRVDFDGLSQHIRKLLNDTNISILQQASNEAINRQIIETILPSASLLPLDYIDTITGLLIRVAGTDQPVLNSIRLFEKQQKQKNNLQQYKILLVVALTILICWIIYALSQ